MTFENLASWGPSSAMNDPTDLIPEIARGVPLIKVLGIGGGGSNAVSRMYQDRLPVVEYWALNTDT
jgi:cell division GTPase FtsZ